MLMDEISLVMVINLYQTGINYVPASSQGMVKMRTKRLWEKDDKHQISKIFGILMNADFLSIFNLFIYTGKHLKQLCLLCTPSST